MHPSLSAARLAAAAAALVAAFALAGPALATAAHRTSTVKVTATEFKFKLSPATAKAGSVTFSIVNKGKLAHDFMIAGKKSRLVKPGKTGKLTVRLKAGKYPYKCTVPGHAAAGMKGTLSVR
jgi:uncharacterized cupredoxin-like copper-binding protein